MSTVVNLEITSFQGVSVGAEHYYGKLKSYDPYQTFEIEKVLTEREAAALRIKDDWPGFKAGDKTTRFNTRDEIIEIAERDYKKIFVGAKVLTLGSSTSAEPQEILDAPKPIMRKGNEMFQEVEAMGWIQRGGFFYRHPEHQSRLNQLCREYSKLLAGVK